MNEEQIHDALVETLGEDVVEQLADMTRRLSVIDAVVQTETTDVDTLADWIYHDKMHLIPLDFIREVVSHYLPQLSDEGLVVDGKPSPQAIIISAMHLAHLNEGAHLNG